MIELQEKSPFLAHFVHRQSADEPAWLRRLRAEAMGRFSDLGFPTTHHEDWKYTNVGPIARATFDPAYREVGPASWPVLARLASDVRLVFVNGWFSRELSTLGRLPGGVHVSSIAETLRENSTALESHLGRHAPFTDHAFVALNTALAEDGALVIIDKDVVLDQPVLLVYLSQPGGRQIATHPRTLILAERGSQASAIEIFAGPDDSAYFTNAVTEIVTREGSVLDHCRVQLEGRRAYHVATVQGVQDRASVLNSHNISLGAALARHDVNSVLDAEGAECVLNGLYVAGEKQHVDNHTLLDHAKPNCMSHELYKGILSGHAAGVFNGKIIVRQDAQKTNAIQSNKNLLLSGDAVINTKPQLEIYADDVRCTHGATVGQLDHEALFYMRTRGIPERRSRELLTHAFASEVIDSIRWKPLREALEAELP